MKKIISTLASILLFMAYVIAQPGSIENTNHSINNHHDVNTHTLQMAFDTTACGLNYTQATSVITTRYNAYSNSTFGHGFPDTLTITALPANYSIAKAYIYFAESYTTACTTPIVTFSDPGGNTHNAGATLQGIDGPVCWSEVGTYGFRADVTNSITTNGNYILDSISCTSVWEIDGVTLLIIYQDLSAAYQGTFVIYDGCIGVTGGTESTKVSGFNICQTPLTGRGFVISGDFQDNVMNGVHVGIINNDSIFFPSRFFNFDDTTANFVAGQISTQMGASSSGDCFLVAALGIYYTDNCIQCPSITSVPNNIQLSDFTVNPNPTSGLINILSSQAFNKTIHLSLVNVLGQEIINQTWNPAVSERTSTLDIQNFSKGIYFLILQSDDKKLYFKIVKS